MKTIILFFSCVFLLGNIQAQDIHRIAPNSPDELHDFFSYRKGSAPLVSGHRGGMEPGFPENSIEALANTLRYTPAFFEIDPRLTRDSVIVLLHDATLDRTTTGSGSLGDMNWEEVRKLKLKDSQGVETPFRVPTLEEAIRWAKGKTILNLDRKDVPLEMTAKMLIRMNALSYVMVTVHQPEQAAYYLSQDSGFMFSAFIRDFDELQAYEEAGIPWNQIMAYVGPLSKPENQELYDALHGRGVKVMVSAAPSYDKETDLKKRAAEYRRVITDGADVLESDYPIQVAKAWEGFEK